MSELRGDEDPQESKCKTQIFLISLDMVGLINPSDCRIVLKCARQRLLLQRGQGPLTALIGHTLVAKKVQSVRDAPRFHGLLQLPATLRHGH